MFWAIPLIVLQNEEVPQVIIHAKFQGISQNHLEISATHHYKGWSTNVVAPIEKAIATMISGY